MPVCLTNKYNKYNNKYIKAQSYHLYPMGFEPATFNSHLAYAFSDGATEFRYDIHASIHPYNINEI